MFFYISFLLCLPIIYLFHSKPTTTSTILENKTRFQPVLLISTNNIKYYPSNSAGGYEKLKEYAFIVLNFEKFWNRLCQQNRDGKANHSFVRRGKMGPKKTKKLFFYVTHPKKEIQGYADFIENITGEAKNLWETLGHESLLNTYDEYQDFLQGRTNSTFVRFKNLKEFPKPVTIKELAKIIKKQRMPQGGMYMTRKMPQQLLAAGNVTP